MTNTYWNAEVYDRIGTPMRGWAQQVIDDLQLRGEETVLDAGCGSGSVTLDLLQKLPHGKIYAVDASAEMIVPFILASNRKVPCTSSVPSTFTPLSRNPVQSPASAPSPPFPLSFHAAMASPSVRFGLDRV